MRVCLHVAHWRRVLLFISKGSTSRFQLLFRFLTGQREEEREQRNSGMAACLGNSLELKCNPIKRSSIAWKISFAVTVRWTVLTMSLFFPPLNQKKIVLVRGCALWDAIFSIVFENHDETTGRTTSKRTLVSGSICLCLDKSHDSVNKTRRRSLPSVLKCKPF